MKQFALAIIICVSIKNGLPIRCYDCTSQLSYFDYDACLYGDERYLRAVTCQEPSVCAAYHYQTQLPDNVPQLSISRGCQAIRYGITCEDIFNDLRRTGSVLPGQHTCATCSTDLCNTGPRIYVSPGLFSAILILLLCSLLTYT